jgi:hypothetical protein
MDITWSPSRPRANETVFFSPDACNPIGAADWTREPYDYCIADIGGGGGGIGSAQIFRDGDGWVDSTDSGMLGISFGKFEGDPLYNTLCDFNQDGVVDSTDSGVMGVYWGGPWNFFTEINSTIVDGKEIGSYPYTNTTFTTYSPIAHNITLTVTDSEGNVGTITKQLTVNRDLAIVSIWPSMEDYQGSIEHEFISGKYVIILVRGCNLGSITEYTDNSKGDFLGTQMTLWLVHSDGTEEPIYTRTDVQLRRYYKSNSADDQHFEYDWAPTVGASYWKAWDLWGAEPETDLYLKANFTVPVAGDTDPSNNELWFGPFNITAGYDHDVRLEGIWTYDDVSYYHPIPPYPTTTYNYYYGYSPGDIANITVGLSNVGIYDENVTFHVYAGDTEIYTANETLDVATGYFEFTFPWDTTGFYGTYTLQVYVEPVSGEAGRWATWDNNTPENYNAYGLMFFNAYDSWGVYS